MHSLQVRTGVASCSLARGTGGSGVKVRGRDGCNQWEREPGIDDDDWDPPGTPVIGRYVPEPPLAPRARSQGRDGWWTEPPRPRRAVAPAAHDSLIVALLTRDPFRGYFLQDDD